jgi:dihydroneopterin aldolase
MTNGHMTIELKGLRFFSDHGLYAEELKTGNEFEIDVTIEYNAPAEIIRSIDETLDYVEAYGIVQSAFGVRQQLLETSAMKIAEALHHRFSFVTKTVISIRKVAPLLTNFVGSLGVTYTRLFK